MPTQRYFLGWDRPVLPTAADWLLGRFGRDLSEITVVLPTRRAGRRLEDLLLDRQAALGRPNVVTVGRLPDLLVEAAGIAVAEALPGALAWVAVLRRFSVEQLRPLVPNPPEPDNFAAWWNLAERLARLREELGVGCRTLSDVATTVGGARWQALATLESAYDAALREQGLIDRHAARFQAIKTVRLAGPVVLVAVADLNPLLTGVLARTDEAHTLIAADECEHKGFDHHGGLHTAYWASRGVDVQDQAVRFVDQRGDQPAAAVAALAELAKGRSQDDVAIGLGEEALAPAVKNAIELAGGTARSAVGRTLSQTGPCSLLTALGRFLERRRFDALAALLRHPDLEHYLDGLSEAQSARQGALGWQTFLDEFISRTLRTEAVGDWLNDPVLKPALGTAYRAVATLLPEDPAVARPLNEWSTPIREVLREVYAGVELNRFVATSAAAAEALAQLGEVLDEQQRLAPGHRDTPEMTAGQAIAWTVARVASRRVADPPGGGAVELMGLLDIALDDAPVTALTSLNEGDIPAGSVPDGFLPDGLRRTLGLPDAERRLARDTYLLNVVAHSREACVMLAARHNDEGDPLKPSRTLLLGHDDGRMVRRLQRFYADPGPARNPDPAVPMLIAPGGENRFVIPEPPVDVTPPETLRVTAFRDYLACPYRFYLKHILGLGTLDDAAVELDASAFGNLIHDALARFGTDGPHESRDPSVIAGNLSGHLDDLVDARYGTTPRAAVRLQVESARERLRAFAEKQAQWTDQGWRVLAVEADYRREFIAAGKHVTVKGRIDRIDYHEQHGLRIIDYKTGDSGLSPNETHRTRRGGQEVWVDLQLPLYRALLEHVDAPGIAEARAHGMELGYVLLPRNTADAGWSPAKWDDTQWRDADTVRDAVIAAILGAEFWPPGDPPSFDDGLAAICGDDWPGRQHYVRHTMASRGALHD